MWNSVAFREAIHHEMYRDKPAAGIFADIYDTPAWKKMMGELKDVLERIGIHFCIDGIPAFIYKVGVGELPDCLHCLTLYNCHFFSILGTIIDARRVCDTFLAAVDALQGQQHFDQRAYPRKYEGEVTAQVFQKDDPRRV